MNDASFREFFEKECHVCANTVSIFEKMDRDRLSIETVASLLQADPQSLQKLRDADYCDPELVVRLCRQLELPIPQDCPRKSNDY
jgi:hypothetical protein